MTLAQFMEANPFITISSVAVAAGGIVAGIMAYVEGKSSERKLAIETQRRELEVGALKAELKANDNRFARIERDLGGAQGVLDVSKLTVTTATALALPGEYQPIDDGLFFVDAPQRLGWSHHKMLESQLTREALIIAPEHLPPMHPDVPLHVWQHDETHEFATHIRMGPGATIPISLVFRPKIIVQYVDPATAAAINARLAGAGQSPVGEATTAPVVLAPGQSPAEITTRLEQLLRGKLPLVLLVQAVTQGFNMEANTIGARVTFDTLRQVGNVLYTRQEVGLSGVDRQTSLTVLQETFFVGVADGGYFIRTQLPTRNGISEHGGYIQQWLSGLRLPASPPTVYS